MTVLLKRLSITPRSFFMLALLGLMTACASGTYSGGKSSVKVYLADVKIGEDLVERTKLRRPRLRATNNDRPLRLSDAKQQATALSNTLSSAIGPRYTLVSKSGADVYVVQTTLTDLDANQPTLGDYDGQPNLSLRSRYAGRAAMEMTISLNGETIIALSEDYQGDFSDRVRRESRWGDAKFAYRIFATDLIKALADVTSR